MVTKIQMCKPSIRTVLHLLSRWNSLSKRLVLFFFFALSYAKVEVSLEIPSYICLPASCETSGDIQMSTLKWCSNRFFIRVG